MMDRPEHPRDEAASSWCSALPELERWAERVAADGPAEPYLAQRRPSGSALRLATVTEDGMHRVLAINRVPERGALEPVQLTEYELAEVRSTVRALLDLAGQERGCASIDVVLTPTGPHIVACQLGTE